MRIHLQSVLLSAALVGLAAVAAGPATAESPTFRGVHRDGVFEATGLAGSWPAAGPPRLWTATGLGDGYSSVTVVGGRIFTTGMSGTEGFLTAFDLDGKKLWRASYGEEHPGNGYPGARTTPSFSDGTLFLFSSSGKAVALDAETGAIRWQVDTLKQFEGQNLYFGLAESPLVDGDKVIVTPGGKDASVVALDKKTGELIWRTQGLSDISAYCSARIVEVGSSRQLVTFLKEGLVGLDPESGKTLWKQPLAVSYDIHAISPLLDGDILIVSHGNHQGTRGYKLSPQGVKEAWYQEKLDVYHGGAVVVDGRYYGAASNGTWYALDTKDGSIEADAKRLGKGAVVYADGKLYGYNERGEVSLVEPKNLKAISWFKIQEGEGQHWAHPVISDGVLYIRHGDVLIAFDVRART